MKYRRLSNDELKNLEPEFVQFLASQSITATDWERLKGKSPQKTDQLIEIFSDIVLEKVLSQIKLLELRTADQLILIQCGDDHFMMRGIQLEGEGRLDLTTEIQRIDLEDFLADTGKVRVISGEKKLRKSRNEDIYQFLQEGFLISKNQVLFDSLEALHQ